MTFFAVYARREYPGFTLVDFSKSSQVLEDMEIELKKLWKQSISRTENSCSLCCRCDKVLLLYPNIILKYQCEIRLGTHIPRELSVSIEIDALLLAVEIELV